MMELRYSVLAVSLAMIERNDSNLIAGRWQITIFGTRTQIHADFC